MTTMKDFHRLVELAGMPADELIKETKRSIVFLNGHQRDWFCGASSGIAERFGGFDGCSLPLDINKRPPMIVDIQANAPNCEPIGCRVTMCADCSGNITEETRQEVKRFVLDANPTCHDADHVPPEAQTMLPGTRPDPSKVLTVTMEIW